jgi:hypothetical protein
MIVGFSPRKSKISRIWYADFPERESLLAHLGKLPAGVGCIYVNKFEDIRPEVLRELIVSDGHFHPGAVSGPVKSSIYSGQ